MLYRNSIGEDRRLIKEIKTRMAAACPDVHFETGDYGLSLYGFLTYSDTDKTVETSIRCICRPARPADPESNFEGQSEIIADVDELIKFWST